MHEARDTDLARRLEAAEREAREARGELERLRRRRIVRIALVLASLPRHPRRLARLPALILAALRRPAEPPPGGGAEAGRTAAAEPGVVREEPVRDEQPPERSIPDEPPPYPHLDIAHLDGACSFDGLARCIPADPEAWRGRHDGGADLLLLEPGRVAATGPVEARRLLEACEADGVPTVLVAHTASDVEAGWTGDVDLVVTDDPDVADRVEQRSGLARALAVEPWVDAGCFNPVGWEREPPHGVLCLVATADARIGASVLGPLLADPPPGLAVRSSPEAEAGLPPTLRAVAQPAAADPDALAADLKCHRAVLALPELHANEAAYLRHVLAAAACGTPVVTTPSPRLESLLPPDGLRVVRTPEEASAAFVALADDDERERTSVRARRRVFTRHTARDRLDEVLGALGIPTTPPETVSVILSTHREDLLERAIDNVARQRYAHKELVVVLHGGGPEVADRVRAHTAELAFPTTVVPAPAEWTFGDCLNAGLRAATADLVAKMDDDDLYGPEHLTDLVAARRYAPGDVVGKWAQYVYLEERDVTIARQTGRQERLGTHLPGPTFLIPRDLLRRFGFSRVDAAIDTALWRRLRAEGGRLYSTHRYNFIRVRHGSHTYQRSDETFLESADAVVDGLHRAVLDV